MKHFLRVAVLISIISWGCIAYASDYTDDLENKILSKDWRGVHKTLDNPDRTLQMDKSKLNNITVSTKAVMSFMRYYYSFINTTDKESKSYRTTLINSYNNIPTKLPFSKKLINDIGDKKNKIDERFAVIDSNDKLAREEEIRKREETHIVLQNKKAIEDERRRLFLEELEKDKKRMDEERRIEELQRAKSVKSIQPETVSLTLSEMSIAAKSPIYQKYDIVCSVCSSIENKSKTEAALKNDMKYANKYGVVNYSRRDRAVQSIKHSDSVIVEGKKKYLELYGRKFNKKECDLVNTEDCEGALFALSNKILGRLPWEPDDIYPKP